MKTPKFVLRCCLSFLSLLFNSIAFKVSWTGTSALLVVILRHNSSFPIHIHILAAAILFNSYRMGEQSNIRPDMVEAARKFMLTPKVRDTPFEEQRQFLLGKGLQDISLGTLNLEGGGGGVKRCSVVAQFIQLRNRLPQPHRPFQVQRSTE